MTFAALLLAAVLAADDIKPKYKPGKETTFVEGPLDKNGLVDFAAAVNDRLGKGVTAENNALVPLLEALGPPKSAVPCPPEFYRRLGISPPPEKGAYLTPFEEYQKAKGTPLDPESEVPSRLSTRPWTAKEQPEAAAWLKENDANLALIVKASLRSEYYHPLTPRDKDGKRDQLLTAPLGAVQANRTAANALCCRAMLRLGEGTYDDAWADVLATYRLARLCGRGGSLIELLVGIAFEAMAHTAAQSYISASGLSAAKAAAAVRDLEALPPMPPLAGKIALTERMFFLDGLQWTAHMSAADAADLLGAKKATDAQNKMYRDAIDWEAVLRRGNKWYDRMAASLSAPTPAERAAAVNAIEQDVRKQRKAIEPEIFIAAAKLRFGGEADASFRKAVTDIVGTSMIGLLTPALMKVQEAELRTEMNMRLLKVAFALAAFRADTGNYPPALADLSPKYLKAVEPDIFGGKPLVYKPAAAGYVLYSVGVNGKDDDGRSFNTDPKGDDLVIRIPPAKK